MPKLRDLLSIANQLVKGLMVLHSKNLIHLDIKPANILFGLDKVWKYADLGVSKTIAQGKEHISHLNGFTATYSSPEQYQLMSFNSNCKITKKSDTYSLGIVFMELTGADLNKKWVIPHKTQNMQLSEEVFNKEYSEFNERVIMPMIKYSYVERIDLEELIVVIEEMWEGKQRIVKDDGGGGEKEQVHEENQIDEQDPLNFDSQQYKQVQQEYLLSKQKAKKSSMISLEVLPNRKRSILNKSHNDQLQQVNLSLNEKYQNQQRQEQSFSESKISNPNSQNAQYISPLVKNRKMVENQNQSQSFFQNPLPVLNLNKSRSNLDLHKNNPNYFSQQSYQIPQPYPSNKIMRYQNSQSEDSYATSSPNKSNNKTGSRAIVQTESGIPRKSFYGQSRFKELQNGDQYEDANQSYEKAERLKLPPIMQGGLSRQTNESPMQRQYRPQFNMASNKWSNQNYQQIF